MKNGTEQEVIKSFNKISNFEDSWDHNKHYQKYLLDFLPKRPELALDIGCGTGEFSLQLSKYSQKVIGIDVSPQMIAQAHQRFPAKNISYLEKDAESFLRKSENKFDVIASIATLHHTDLAEIFDLVNKALTPNGVFLVLDLYEEKSLVDKVISGLAALVNPWFNLLKNGQINITEEESKAWEEHAKFDKYSSLGFIKKHAQKAFGKVKIKRHLFWRYSLIATKR